MWSAAPAPVPGEDHDQRCRAQWTDIATSRGLSLVDLTTAHDGRAIIEHRSAGLVEIDGLRYEVRVGPRQRTRYVNDDGDVCWGLIDAVWVESLASDPVAPAPA